jgi:metal-responsive CopG/Arc/MetJ family transcriptional regulator
MKTAISIPDEVFLAAEQQAKRTHKSRSQLYTEAMVEYLSRHCPDQVTEAMNRALSQLEEEPDPFVQQAARQILKGTEW